MYAQILIKPVYPYFFQYHDDFVQPRYVRAIKISGVSDIRVPEAPKERLVEYKRDADFCLYYKNKTLKSKRISHSKCRIGVGR